MSEYEIIMIILTVLGIIIEILLKYIDKTKK